MKSTRALIFGVLAGLVGLAFVIIAIFAMLNTPRRRLRIGFVPFTGSLPLLVADHEKFFEKHGLDVELVVYQKPAEMLADVGTKIDEPGPTSLVDVVAAHERDPDEFQLLWAALESGDGTTSAILVPPSSTLTDLAELRESNLMVGLYDSTSARSSLRAILERKGLRPDVDVRLLADHISTHTQLLSGGHVAVLYTVEPYSTYLIQTNQAKLLIGNPRARLLADPFLVGVIAISRTHRQKDPDTVRKFTAALADAFQLMSSKPTAATSAMLDKKYRLPYNPAMLQMSSQYRWVAPNEGLAAAADRNVQLWARLGTVKTSVSTDSWWVDPQTVIAK